MKHTSLAAHYRPQTFAEVTGQDMITTVLSRAAAEDRVAPAYLLSGTRGVGKTTIARILAKALNCKEAPTTEPCNVCTHCLMITQGNHVDVTEIDGASNNSVDDARALRENIGYAPMEGRYKVFIIDEAHMLSRSAFNALLKTLEEPPPRVVFIFATTEVHKFPITIVSRCQHFIFKRLSEDGLVAHLSRVLEKEAVSFDPQAVRIIARRAAGSVRDGMSLLGQTLALGHESLSVESTRSVLGLAGQELFVTLLQAIAKQECAAVIDIMYKLSQQGIDIGFFLRELIHLWRTLFLLREAGPSIVPSLELTAEESELWTNISSQFAAAHLHAAWHMTLDAQRKIIQSPEPAAALELLLLNLTLMPRLLPLQAVQLTGAPPTETATAQGIPTNQAPVMQGATSPMQNPHTGQMPTTPPMPVQTLGQNAAVHSTHQRTPSATAESSTADADTEPEPQSNSHAPHNITPPAPHPENAAVENASLEKELPMHTQSLAAENTPEKEKAPLSNAVGTTSSLKISWEEAQELLRPVLAEYILRQAQGEFSNGTLRIITKSHTVFEHFQKKHLELEEKLKAFYSSLIKVELVQPTVTFKPESVLIEEFSAREELQECFKILDASLFKVRQI